jgi:choloylglycine hydrolase
MELNLNLEKNEEAVDRKISIYYDKKEVYPIEHLQLIDDNLKFTFKTKGGALMEIKGVFNESELKVQVLVTEDYYGSYILYKP